MAPPKPLKPPKDIVGGEVYPLPPSNKLMPVITPVGLTMGLAKAGVVGVFPTAGVNITVLFSEIVTVGTDVYKLPLLT